jgi:chemotaxis protein MotB
MWLLNATTEDQRKGLADYFSPNNLMSHASSGTGEPFGGHTAFDEGALVSDRGSVQVTPGKRPLIEHTEDGEDPVYTETHYARSGDGIGEISVADDQDSDASDKKGLGEKGTRPAPGPGPGSEAIAPQIGQQSGRPITAADIAAEKAKAEKAAFEQAAEQIKEAVRSDPALSDLAKQLAIDMTPDGLRIQIIDEIKLPMFPSGSSTPNERVRLLMQKVVPVLIKLKQPISIAGHTDGAPFPGPDRTNWELSAERANATRRVLVDGGFPDNRIKSVIGAADRDPLLPADPLAAANRRIAILVMREQPLAPPAARSAPVAVSDVAIPATSIAAPATVTPGLPWPGVSARGISPSDAPPPGLPPDAPARPTP